MRRTTRDEKIVRPGVYEVPDGLDVEKFAELVRADEREVCAQVCEDLIGTRAMARHCADAIRARGDVHASDISQERVDETAKDRHEFECPRCGHCCKPDWVGLDDDIPGLGLVTEEFYNGMLCAEDILRKRNT